MKTYQYKKTKLYLSEDELIDYLNKLGAEGWNIFSILARGAVIKGKRLHTLIAKKEIIKLPDT